VSSECDGKAPLEEARTRNRVEAPQKKKKMNLGWCLRFMTNIL
jgi:hypothetical protein